MLISVTIAVLVATKLNPIIEDHRNYFAFVMFILPALTFLLCHGTLGKRIVRPVLAISYWLTFYVLFVDYQDRPWFSQEPMSCDGPCFGWYTFENESIYTPLLVISAISLLGGMAFSFTMAKIKGWLESQTLKSKADSSTAV